MYKLGLQTADISIINEVTDCLVYKISENSEKRSSQFPRPRGDVLQIPNSVWLTVENPKIHFVSNVTNIHIWKAGTTKVLAFFP